MKNKTFIIAPTLRQARNYRGLFEREFRTMAAAAPEHLQGMMAPQDLIFCEPRGFSQEVLDQIIAIVASGTPVYVIGELCAGDLERFGEFSSKTATPKAL